MSSEVKKFVYFLVQHGSLVFDGNQSHACQVKSSEYPLLHKLLHRFEGNQHYRPRPSFRVKSRVCFVVQHGEMVLDGNESHTC